MVRSGWEKRDERRIASRIAYGLIALALLAGALSPLTTQAAGISFYDPTGHSLSGPIRDYWESRGGLWLFGYPISEPYEAVSEDGESIVAQYFERARLEYHPSLDATPYRVLGGRLGYDLTLGRQSERSFLPISRSQASSGCEFFEPTGHSLCEPFRDWWYAKGGLAIFGYPLSEVMTEGGYQVQYFERARFEWHPENIGTDWVVELGHLGVDAAGRTGVASTAAFKNSQALSTSLRVDITAADGPNGSPVGTLTAGEIVRVVDGPRNDWYLVSTSRLTGWVPFSALNWTRTPDPRAASVESLEAFDSDVAAAVRQNDAWMTVGIYDTSTGRLYGGGSGGLIGSASLSKTVVLAVALHQVDTGRISLDDIRGLIEPMIMYSDNDATNTMWRIIGQDVGVVDALNEMGVSGFAIQHPWDWGQTAASGADWARFLALFGSGQLVSPGLTSLALGLMQDVTPAHRWGVSTQGSDRLAIGKNGWYVDDDPYQWRIASAGFVSGREGAPGVAPLVVAIITRYPAELGEGWGIANATNLTQQIMDRSGLIWSTQYLVNTRNLSALPRNGRALGVGPLP
ncbi:MAG: serine hydrolase [Thermomicrobiales bacterium]|nr:serine hydrolase [Thermomicrobiales bacterium]